VVANSDGSGTAQVLPIPDGILHQMHPTYSPDGTKVAMAGGYINGGSVAVDGIMLTNADGTNAQVNASNDISVFSINSSAGALTTVAGSPFSTGNGPHAILFVKGKV